MVSRWNYRSVLLVAFASVALALPAFAQSGTARGTVKDDGGQPVEGATVVIQSSGSGSARTYEIKTSKTGEYWQIGLSSGPYTVTAMKGEIKSQPTPLTVRLGQTATADFTLPLNAAAAAIAQKAKSAELKKLFDEGMAAANSGNNAGAIEKFNQGITLSPDCFDCYNRIGSVHVQAKEYDKAEAAYKKSIEVRPDNPMAYSGLATVYNNTGKGDLASQASAKAIELLGTSSAGAGGAGADASFNQGVIFVNQGKTAEAKSAFEKAIATDANHAEAHYQLGMILIGQNDMKGALGELQTYLKLAPSGPNAAMAKGAVTELEKLQ